MLNRREMLGAVAGLAGAAALTPLSAEERILRLFQKMQPRMVSHLKREQSRISDRKLCFADVVGTSVVFDNSIPEGKRPTRRFFRMKDGSTLEVDDRCWMRFHWLEQNRCFMQFEFFHSP